MKARLHMRALLLLLLLAAGLPVFGLDTSGSQSAAARAWQQTSLYSLSWFTVDGGGVTPAGSTGYSLAGTTGQPDAGMLSGGTYALFSGFWAGRDQPPMAYRIFLPLIKQD
jgi:hypothetical protein